MSLTLNTYEPNSNNYVEEIAKRYFNIDNYELPTGTYIIPNYGNYSIIKENDYYIRSSVLESSQKNTSLLLSDIKKNGDKVIVYYDYFKGSQLLGICYSEESTKEEKESCLIGRYEIELTSDLENNKLIVDKIKYTKK